VNNIWLPQTCLKFPIRGLSDFIWVMDQKKTAIGVLKVCPLFFSLSINTIIMTPDLIVDATHKHIY
jgi:hypothetical protein